MSYSSVAMILKPATEKSRKVYSENTKSYHKSVENLLGYELLLLRRKPSDKDAFAGHVCFPGGRIEKGENHIEAAIRETKEEAGITLN